MPYHDDITKRKLSMVSSSSSITLEMRNKRGRIGLQPSESDLFIPKEAVVDDDSINPLFVLLTSSLCTHLLM